jgi:putative two-component system response regulator
LVYEKTRENEELFLHVVESLADAIDAKDNYTKGHSGRVAQYAKEIAQRYGYDEKQQEQIFMMGLLHDVGKIGVPDWIINKTSRLTAEEEETMAKHPLIGEEILSKIYESPELKIGAAYHHERIDGKGYPNKVKGENMTIDQKILQVADVISALSAKRSYKEAWSIEKTISILEENVLRGQMEKSIVDCFKENQEKIMKESTKLMNDTEKIYLKINKERELLSNK